MEKNLKIILIFGAIILFLLVWLIYSSIKQEEISSINISTGINPPKSNINSQIKIIEFGDFKCPACKSAHPIINEIIEKYNASLYFRNFPLKMHGEISYKASLAAECANEQNKFWEYHNLLYENQETFNEQSLKQFASQLQLNEAKFNNCLDTEKYKSQVQEDINEAVSFGIKGTPTYFINGVQVLGADKEKIEEIIKRI